MIINKRVLTFKLLISILLLFILSCSSTKHDTSVNSTTSIQTRLSEPELVRLTFTSSVDQKTHQYFVYLPKGYQSDVDKQWPVILFLHGNGERGNGNDELDFVLHHGPVYEAWVQKKDLPFIIISPQLPMFDQYQDYMTDRKVSQVPQRLKTGTPPRITPFSTEQPIARNLSPNNMDDIPPLLPQGWELVEQDLLGIMANVNRSYRTDKKRQYLTGLSYGGFGTWYLASKHPNMFAAIAPVVGWGHPSLMAPIAKVQLPIWQFAAGRDSAVPIENFYLGLDTLESLGHTDVRFTVHEAMGHDAWTRVYSSSDLYEWLISHSF